MGERIVGKAVSLFALSGQITASSGGSFTPPGPADFELPPIIPSIPWLTKPLLMAFVSVILIAGFYLITSRRMAMVPGRGQFAGEMVYTFVRNTFGRDMIGQHDFMKFVPLLVTLFSFILVNNVFGVVPFIQFPTFSHIGWTLALAVLSWVIYNGVGLYKHGFVGYLKVLCWPSGVPWPIRFLLTPIELLSNLVVRPLTLCLRLFANMFAGHLVLMVFTLGGAYLLTQAEGALMKPVGVLAFVMGIGFHFLELLVQVLQAYIFTVLTASYISSSLAEDH